MIVVFGTQDLSVEGGTNVTPTGGVSTDANNLLGAIPAVAKLGIGAYQQYQAGKAEAANQSLLSSLSNEFIQINNQVSGNKISSVQANAAKQNLMLKYMSAGLDPTDIKSVMSVGFGKEESFVSEEVKLEEENIDKARGLGLIYSGQSREEQLRTANAMVRSEQNKYKIEEANKKLTYDSNLLDYEKKAQLEEARRAVLDLSVSETQFAQDRVTQVLRDFSTGKYGHGSQAISVASEELDKIQAEFNSSLGALSKGQPELVEALFAPIKMTMDMARKQVVDGYNAESWQTMTQNAIAFQSNIIAQNPTAAQLAAISKLIPSYATTPAAATLVTQFLGPMTQNATKGDVKPPDIVVTDAEVAADPKAGQLMKGYVTPTIQATVKAIESGDEQAINAFSKQINGILNSVGVHGTGQPKDYMRIAEVFANADMAVVMDGLNRNINPEFREDAQKAMESFSYWTIGNIQKNYERETIQGKPVIEVAQPILVSSPDGPRVELRPRQGVTLSVMDKKALRAIERHTAKVLGYAIRAGAHLEGRTDYGQFFNESYAKLFGEKQDDKAE